MLTMKGLEEKTELWSGADHEAALLPTITPRISQHVSLALLPHVSSFITPVLSRSSNIDLT